MSPLFVILIVACVVALIATAFIALSVSAIVFLSFCIRRAEESED